MVYTWTCLRLKNQWKSGQSFQVLLCQCINTGMEVLSCVTFCNLLVFWYMSSLCQQPCKYKIQPITFTWTASIQIPRYQDKNGSMDLCPIHFIIVDVDFSVHTQVPWYQCRDCTIIHLICLDFGWGERAACISIRGGQELCMKHFFSVIQSIWNGAGI